MPADQTLPASSQHHRDGGVPYPCSRAAKPPGAPWAIDYGYCRTSLDWHGPGNPQGQGDPCCPALCPHKAPQHVAQRFSVEFRERGAVAAADWVRAAKGGGAER